MKFVDAHTFHPRRVVGLNRIRLDEYPVRALRAALIDGAAHRGYDDATPKIIPRLCSGQRCWRPAQALAALYRAGTDGKRWVGGVLARKKGLGF